MLKSVLKIFKRDWLLTTFIVLAGSALCIRLGIWQLDRLDQRRAFNAHVESMWAADPVNLPGDEISKLDEMEYRSICVQGNYDLSNQVVLRNQYWRDQYGYHLLTPLIISDGLAVIVDRGWIPSDGNDDADSWRQYDPVVEETHCGIIRVGRERADVGGRLDPTLLPDQDWLEIWNNVNLERMAEQLDYDLLPIYIQLDIDEGDEVPPVPFQPEIEISEGPHLGYAGQWFTFATILFFGYPFFIRWREKQNE